MKRRLHNGSSFESNVWPAVTDTMLLMASIFIVLSVVSVAAMRRQLDDQLGAGSEDGKLLIGKIYSIEERHLFASGQSRFKDPQQAEAALRKNVLADIPKRLPDLRRYADQQKSWNKKYYIILEVAGHADCVAWDSPKPGSDNNWDLSADRATTVIQTINRILEQDPNLRRELEIKQDQNRVAQLGSTVLRLAAYGSHLPAMDYSSSPTDLEKRWNRRVEIRVFAQPENLVQVKRGKKP